MNRPSGSWHKLLTREASRLTRGATMASALVALTVGVAFPTGYLLLSYRYQSTLLELVSERMAQAIAVRIYASPTYWRFEEHRLAELLDDYDWPDGPLDAAIVERDGRIAAANGHLAPWPRLAVTIPIRGVNDVAASLRVQASLRGLLLRGLPAAALGAVLGVAILLLGWLLPRRSVTVGFGRLMAPQAMLQFVFDALDQSGQAVFILSPDGRVAYANAAGERASGLSREALLQHDAHALGLIRSAGQTPQAAAAAQAVAEDNRAHHTYRRPDGSECNVLASSLPMQDADGHLLGQLVIWQDVSEQVRLEETLRHTLHLRSLGTLAAGIAHDMNNMLTPILGYAEILRQGSAEGSKERAFIDTIAKSAVRAKDLVAQILLIGGRREGRRSPVDLSRLVSEVTQFLRGTAPPSIAVQEACDPGVGKLLADASRVHQVLMNLCINAMQAMPQGGALTVSLAPVRLTKHICTSGHRLNGPFAKVTVKDSGVGMDAVTRDRMFEPFFTTRGVGQGTGLGLSIAYSIVEQHGGGLDIESAPGQGTAVSVYLPVTGAGRAQPAAASAAVPAPVRTSARGTVLLVDDESSVRDLSRALLERLGYQVQAFASPTAALRAFSAAPRAFELVLTDLTMPDLTGEELAARIEAVRADVPIVIYTGYHRPETDRRASQASRRQMLAKPFTMADLSEAIGKALSAQ